MITSDWEKFSESYIAATAEQRSFIDSNIIPIFVRSTLQKQSIQTGIIRELVLFCSGKVLGISSDAELLAFIAQNGLDAQKITTTINAALSLFITESDYDNLSHQAITNDVRKNLFNAANPTQKYLAFSNQGKLTLADISSKFNLFDTDARKKVAILVTDIILGFYKIEDTVPLLQQELGVDARTAALFGADVLDFLAPLSNPNFVVPQDATDEETGVVPSTIAPEGSAPIALGSNYATNQNQPPLPVPTYQPAATPAIAPELHTMAMDATVARANYQPVAEPVYSSEQANLRQPLSDLPSYTNRVATSQNSTPIPPIEPPRWGV